MNGSNVTNIRTNVCFCSKLVGNLLSFVCHKLRLSEQMCFFRFRFTKCVCSYRRRLSVVTRLGFRNLCSFFLSYLYDVGLIPSRARYPVPIYLWCFVSYKIFGCVLFSLHALSIFFFSLLNTLKKEAALVSIFCIYIFLGFLFPGKFVAVVFILFVDRQLRNF